MLDITMQPLIQPIYLKSLNLVFIFLKDSVISLAESTPKSCSCCTWKQNKKCYHLNRVFGQKFTRNAKNGFECLKLIWSGAFAIFNTEPLWFWPRIRSWVKISHYIQPSNLSSALGMKLFNHWLAADNLAIVFNMKPRDIWIWSKTLQVGIW